MNTEPASRACELVCACLQVTEPELRAAIATRDIRTLRELRHLTGAGDGCTACHHALRRFLDTPPRRR